MEYFVAVSSRDGVMVHQHFGHTEEFLILKVIDNERYVFAGRRRAGAVCRTGEHDDGQLAKTVELLSDCRYVLSAKIGAGAQTALRAGGVTPLEIAHFIDYAMEKVMLYDKKRKNINREENQRHAG